jgi:hypothetical protein
MTLSIFQWLVLVGLLLIFLAVYECRGVLREINDKLGDANEHLEALETSSSSIDDKIELGETDPETGAPI